jgi:hypothetical protein
VGSQVSLSDEGVAQKLVWRPLLRRGLLKRKLVLIRPAQDEAAKERVRLQALVQERASPEAATTGRALP